MEGQNSIPLMLELLFGEAAGAARQGASPRLLSWCRAFDEWLAPGRQYTKPTIQRYARAWRRLLGRCPKMPWELSPADLQAHAAWMQAQGFLPKSFYDELTAFTVFYRWCGERQVDPQCGPGFNPAAQVPRPKLRHYASAVLLSRAEVRALLDVLRRDASPLGRRDYALILARLRLGVPLPALQRLQWGQIEADRAGAAVVRWRPAAAPAPLPAEVWQAVRDCLAASGRLAGMRPQAYVFAPLADNFRQGDRPEDWSDGRCLTDRQILNNLKLYGRLAGIPDEKLTLRTLRQTALRLRLEEGASPEEIHAFLDSRVPLSTTRYRLRSLPPLPPDPESGEEAAGDKLIQLPPNDGRGQEPAGDGPPQPSQDDGRGQEAAGDGPPKPPLPSRMRNRLQGNERLTHGLYARSQPAQEVLAVLAEDIHGLEEEICGLRTLARGLLARLPSAGGSREAARVGEAYAQAASRLGEMIQAEAQLADAGKAEAWAEELLERMNALAQAQGRPPTSREEVLAGGRPPLPAAGRQLAEEIASDRYVLRNTYRLAMAAAGIDELLRLVENYGRVCARLVRLLKIEQAAAGGRLGPRLREIVDRAIRETVEEMELGNEHRQT